MNEPSEEQIKLYRQRATSLRGMLVNIGGPETACIHQPNGGLCEGCMKEHADYLIAREFAAVRQDSEDQQDERIIGKLQEFVDILKTAPQAVVHKQGVEQGREEAQAIVLEVKKSGAFSAAKLMTEPVTTVCDEILRRFKERG